MKWLCIFRAFLDLIFSLSGTTSHLPSLVISHHAFHTIKHTFLYNGNHSSYIFHFHKIKSLHIIIFCHFIKMAWYNIITKSIKLAKLYGNLLVLFLFLFWKTLFWNLDCSVVSHPCNMYMFYPNLITKLAFQG